MSWLLLNAHVLEREPKTRRLATETTLSFERLFLTRTRRKRFILTKRIETMNRSPGSAA
jgi:hypothetical protein